MVQLLLLLLLFTQHSYQKENTLAKPIRIPHLPTPPETPSHSYHESRIPDHLTQKPSPFQVQRDNLAYVHSMALHTMQRDSLVAEYQSAYSVLHFEQLINVTVKVYESRLFSPSLADPEYDYYLFLFDREHLIGQIGISLRSYPDPHIMLHDFWNLRPTTYKRVGTVIMKETVYSILFRAKHLRKRQDLLIHWKKQAEKAVLLESVFEALVFYDSMCFKLAEPTELIMYEPLVPQFQDILQLLENADSMQGYSEIDFYKSKTTEYKMGKPVKGIESRFRKGKPTQPDWEHVNLLLSIYKSEHSYYNEQLDYELFVKTYPGLSDYMDASNWLKLASMVLDDEKQRIASGAPVRSGFHGSIMMILDKRAFLKKFPE